MAFAEARAAWQRTANRCFVQEDAKRAPKLACCSSATPSAKEAELRPSATDGDPGIPFAVYVPFDPEPSLSNLSPSSRWWLQGQRSYGYHRGLTVERLHAMECDAETCHFKESSQDFVESETDFVIVDKPSIVEPALIDQCSVKEENDRTSYTSDCSDRHKLVIEEDCSKKGHDETLLSYVDLESSWTVGMKSGPWWRTDSEELALLVAVRSLTLVENCDLPLPQKKGTSVHQNVVKPLNPLSSNDYVSGSISGWSSFQKHGLQSQSRRGEVPKMDNVGEGTAQLLEALRHSQTRARESEEAAKQACAEKEHIFKLLLKQASHLFAYKQWLQLLQLENGTNLNKIQQELPAFPTKSHHSKPLKRTKTSKNRQKSNERHTGCDIGTYAMAFVVSLSLFGAGLMLGWGMALFLPPW